MMNDVDAFCRTCMHPFYKNSSGCVKSYDIFQIPNLADKLKQCCNLPVQPFDKYPRSLCEKCYERIMEFSDFQKVCRESLRTFMDILSFEKGAENCAYTESLMDYPATQENLHTQCAPEIEASQTFEADDYIVEEIIATEIVELNSVQTVGLGENGIEMNETQHADNETITFDNAEEENCLSASETADSEQVLFNDPNDTGEECVVDTLSEDDDESEQGPASIGKYPFHCNLCPKVFTYEHRLTAHMRCHKGLAAYPCNREKCTRAFSRLFDLRQHLREHDGFPREIYKCDVDNCGKEYSTKAAINIHMRKQHNFGTTPGTRKFICDVCNAVLSNESSLQHHHLIHVDRALWPFGCDVSGCTARFRKVNQLKDHINRHSGVKPYICPHCDKRFCTSSNLSIHVNYHTWEKTYPCQVCTRIFLESSKLRSHVQKVHELNQQGFRYPCRMCDKTLATHTARKYHERTHTGEKPYVCEECGRGFTQPSGLNAHKRTHLEMEFRKDYACHICNKAFSSTTALKHHVPKHTGEKPYECEYCGIRFAYPTSLVRHRKQNVCQNLKEDRNREEIENMELSVIDVVGQYEV